MNKTAWSKILIVFSVLAIITFVLPAGFRLLPPTTALAAEGTSAGFGFESGVNNGYPVLFGSLPEPATYDVTYDVTVVNGSGGGAYTEGDEVTVTAEAAESGKRFKNWATDTSITFTGGTSAESETAKFTMPASYVTVTAVYENIYTVTYDGNGSTGGTVPTDSTSYSGGATVTVSDNTGSLTKTDHTFAGWNTAAGGTGTSYQAGSTFVISADITLYAQWTDNTVYVTGVSLNKSQTDLTVGYMETLTATVTPANATNTAVSWSSSDPGIVTVDQTGKITAVASGTATITVTTADGDFTAACSVTVSDAILEYQVTVVNGTSNKSSCPQGEAVTITADAAPAGQRFLNWTTDSSGVIFVNENNESTTFQMPPNAVTVTANYVPVTETTDVTFTAVQVGGTSGTANSTGIQITFSHTVTSLTINNITVINGTGAVVQGALSGSGAVYTVSLSSVTTQGNVIVSIGDFGTYNVKSSPQIVAVYKNTAASGGTVLYGDLSGKGYVDNSDLILMFRFFSQPDIAVDSTAADVNCDGVVNNADMQLLLRYFAQPGIVLGPQ